MFGGARWLNDGSLGLVGDTLIKLTEDGMQANISLVGALSSAPEKRLYHSGVYSDFYGSPGGIFIYGGLALNAMDSTLPSYLLTPRFATSSLFSSSYTCYEVYNAI